MSPELTAVMFGLLSAATFGAGDFTGGFATRRANVIVSVLVVELVGVFLMLGLALLTAEPIISSTDLLWGAVGGIVGPIGLLALYRALAGGSMGLAAPVSAALGAAVPAVFGIIREGSPGVAQIVGFVVALGSIWLVTYSGRSASRDSHSLALACFAGLMFGILSVVFDQIHPGAVFWPLVAARLASVILVMGIILVSSRPALPENKWLFGLMALAGVLDIFGNAFFIVANGSGRLDISAVLAGLYPAMTVVLARIILKEKFSRMQIIGVVGALIAIALIVL